MDAEYSSRGDATRALGDCPSTEVVGLLTERPWAKEFGGAGDASGSVPGTQYRRRLQLQRERGISRGNDAL